MPASETEWERACGPRSEGQLPLTSSVTLVALPETVSGWVADSRPPKTTGRRRAAQRNFFGRREAVRLRLF